MKLAVVDDDNDVRTAVARLLSAMGHHVRVFPSAEDFEAETVVVDCVILDVRLPGATGLELRERLRRGSARTPVVLITGNGDRLTLEAAAAVDTPLITKPFDAAKLTGAIAAAIAAAPRT